MSVPPSGKLKYPSKEVFPDEHHWERLTAHSFGQKVMAGVRRGVAAANLGQSVLDRVLASVEEGELYDGDQPALLSFLLAEIHKDGARITPVFLKNLNDLYPGVPAVSIQNDYPEPNPARVGSCVRTDLSIRI